MSEISTKPYLIRAIHEWCSDNGYTPYLAVMVDENTLVPRGYVKGGEIVLNVSALATNRLRLGNDLIEFEARFGGVAQQISVPVDNVSAIYARENGHGMAFEVVKPPAVPEAAPDQAPGGAGDGDSAGAQASPQAASDEASGTPGQAGEGRSESGTAEADTTEAGSAGEAPAAVPRRAPTRVRRGLSLASGGKTTEPAPAKAPAGSEKAASGSRRKPVAEAGRGKDAGEATDAGKGGTEGGDGDDGGGPPTRGKPKLTRIK